MNKANLKKKWSKYCDTDKLVNDTSELLTKYGHRNSEHGICVVLDKYFEAKEPLIKMFMTSNHYIGDMRIAVKRDFERKINSYEVNSFCGRFSEGVNARERLLKYTDDDGKVVSDYFTTGYKKVDIKTITSDKKIGKQKSKIEGFHLESGSTNESYNKLCEFNNAIYQFGNISLSKIYADNKFGAVDIPAGMKTSRAFNKVCAHYGIDKADGYNKLFAQYADLVSDNSRQLYFVISLNPLDYLTMSIGESWHSCHTIKGYNGDGSMCAGGCVSYMLDTSSIITYVIQNIDAPIHEHGKIYRQMYFYNDNLFIQSRLYPQGNDGAINLYEKFRYLMQEEFCELLNLNENLWKYTTRNDAGRYRIDRGHHYIDPTGSMFYPAEKLSSLSDHGAIKIGSQSYCFYCGDVQPTRRRLSHHDCTY